MFISGVLLNYTAYTANKHNQEYINSLDLYGNVNGKH